MTSRVRDQLQAEKDHSVLHIAIGGYRADFDAPKTSRLWSSDNYCAWQLGRYMKATGRSEPRDVRKSKGYYWFCNDMKFKWLGQTEDFEHTHPNKTFQRVDNA